MAPSLRAMRALLIPAALGTLALAGCGLGDDGPRTTQSRDVAEFTRIDNRGSVDVRLRVGGPQRVRVTAGEKVIDDVHTDVRDGTLRVTFDHDGFGGDNVVVEASVPRLEASMRPARATSTPRGSRRTRSRSAPTAPATSRSTARPGI